MLLAVGAAGAIAVHPIDHELNAKLQGNETVSRFLAPTTFATAAVLERHLGLRAAWPTLLIASYVGVSRLHDNRHFASDVVFGAALGTAVGWTVVGRHGGSSYVWLPVRVPGGAAIVVFRNPVR
jgi:hypothetical protein